MSSPSPSEFLTFYRRVVVRSPHMIRSVTRTPASLRTSPAFAARQFTVSSPPCQKKYPEELSTNDKVKTDQYPDRKPAHKRVEEGDHLDIQASGAKAGMDSAKKSGEGGHATEGRDSAGAKAKAKKEHPEAPDVAIGMQDERGGRGA